MLVHPLNTNEWIADSRYKIKINSIKKQNISVIFNYSIIILTEAMERLLNRGLNFSILPLKLDITQTLVEFKRFQRTMIWKEFWYGQNPDETYKPPIFKVTKTNLPKNHKTHNGLKTYLGEKKSEILDHQNRNKVKSNLPEDEIEALKELIVLQKDHKIMIKQCDKGAGIMILNFQDYIEACDKHLEAKQCGIDGNEKPYYKQVDEETFEEA